MIIRYNISNVSFLYLSPYANLKIMNGKDSTIVNIILSSRLYNSKIKMPCIKKENAEKFLDYLKKGRMVEQKLIEAIQELYPKMETPEFLLDALLQNGILE